MAEPRESPATQLDSVVLIARDYGASSRNDHLHWFMSNLLESKSAASLEDDNLLILHGDSSSGAQIGLSQIETASRLSQLGSGTLYREAVLQRSAKQILAASNTGSGDSSFQYSPQSSSSISTVIRCISSTGSLATNTSETDVTWSSMMLPLGSISSLTKLSIVACKYRVVFTIDASSSMATVDPITGDMLLDQLYLSLERVLTALVQPIRIGNIEFSPYIHASFLLQGSTSGTFHIMLHGLVVNAQNVASTLQQLKQELLKGESTVVAKTTASHVNPNSSPSLQQTEGTSSSLGPNNSSSIGAAPSLQSATHSAHSTTLTAPDLGSPLKNAMFVLKMLPLDACPLIVLLTDGVTALPEECESYDSLLMLMSREDISCSAIQVGSDYHDFTSFAYVPDATFLKHFVNCTGGTYLDQQLLQHMPTRDDTALFDDEGIELPHFPHLSASIKANYIQASLLFRTLVGERFRPKVQAKPTEFGDLEQHNSVDNPFPWEGQAPRQSLYRIPFRQYQLIGVNVLDLLDCRYREGFLVHKLHLDGKSPSEYSVKLWIPWKEHVYITYTIKSTYFNDIPNGTPEIQVALDVIAYYDVQMQWTQLQRSQVPPNPNMLVTRLQQFIMCIIDTDKKLNVLTSQTIILNEILGRSLQTPMHVQIERMFWRALSQLPKSMWHRWFKMERMEIVLSPDLLLNASSVVGNHRIDLRRRVDEFMSQIPSSTSQAVSNRDSVSQSASNLSLVFRFDSAMKELRSHLENWNSFTGSKHSFARILEHTVLTGNNTSQIIAAIASKQDIEPAKQHEQPNDQIHEQQQILLAASKASSEARTLTVPAYCVLRLTWETRNIAMLSLYFFGMHSADRFKIIHNMQTELMAKANPNDPSVNLFSICRKPLRYSLVRYNFSQLQDMMGPADNVPSILSNVLPSLLSPLAARQHPTSAPGSAALASQGSLQQMPDRISVASNSDCSVHVTEDINLRALASFSPVYQLLLQYMNHKRWIWSINSEATQEAAIEAIVRCRLNEGFSLLTHPELSSTAAINSGANGNNIPVSNSASASGKHNLHSFFKEVCLYSGTDECPFNQSCIVQYLVYHTFQGYLVTELWMEPVQGKLKTALDEPRPKDASSPFHLLKSLIYDIDLHLISTITTFDMLSLLHNPHTTKDIISVPTEVKEFRLDSPSLSDVTVQRPPFNLKGLAAVAIQHEESFQGFERDDNTPLHQCLHASLSYLCDRELPNRGNLAMAEPGCPVFTKAIPNSADILLVALRPSASATFSTPSSFPTTTPSSGHSTPLYASTPNASSLKSAPSATSSPRQTFLHPSSVDSLDDGTGSAVPQAHLTVSVYQCSRTVEPPLGSTTQLRALLSAPGQISDPTAFSEPSQPASSTAIHQLCETLQGEHHRNFVKSLFLKLQKGKSDITPKDHTYALQICQEYMAEMDLTQFFRLVSKYHAPNEDDCTPPKRAKPSSISSLGSYGSDSSSPLDAPLTLDTAMLFDRLLACQFRKVPNTEAHFFYNSDGSSAQTAPVDSDRDSADGDSDVNAGTSSFDEDVAVHMASVSSEDADFSQGEDQDDVDDWIDDLSKRYRTAAVITSSSTPSMPSQQQQNAHVMARALSVWSTLPFFIRMECTLVPKSGSANSGSSEAIIQHHWGGDISPSGSSGTPLLRPRRDSPSAPPKHNQLRPPSTPQFENYGGDGPQINVNSFPISTLPNPRQITALQHLSSSGNRAFVRIYAIVLPRHGEGSGFEGSPADVYNSPVDATSPSLVGSPLLARDIPLRGTPAYTKLPKVLRKVLDRLKQGLRSITAQKSLDILRSRVPVTRVISDIVSLNMKQLNPSAYTVIKVPLAFVDQQLGISLFFSEFTHWSLQPIRVIDRTLFFAVQPTPSSQFTTAPLTLSSSVDVGSSALSASLTHDGYTIPYWLLMSPSSNFVTVRFQSTPGTLKPQEKEEILRRTRESINFVAKRINQIILLTQLYEHRVCNILLTNDPSGKLAPESQDPSDTKSPSRATPKSPRSDPISIPKRHTDPNADVERSVDGEGIFEHDSEDRDSPRVPVAPQLPAHANDSPLRAVTTPRTKSAFTAGQFSCDKVHEISIPLNWRTDPKTILNAIAGSVLVHFSVSNRSKMYVYREQSGKIFYMTLSVTSQEDEVDPDGSRTSSRDQQPQNPATTAKSDTTSSDVLSTSISATPSQMSNMSANLGKSREAGPSKANETCLLLTVYGIDTPSEEITVQLRSLLETKLAYFTLQVISTMLLRNPLMKIKPADELFLRSPSIAPRRFQIELPPFITDINLFKSFMKANLLKQGLTLLNLETGEKSADQSGGMAVPHRSGRTPESEPILAAPHLTAPVQTVSSLRGDAGAVYLYNNMVAGSTVAQSKGALNFGAGLATLSVTIQSPHASHAPSLDDLSIGSHSSYDTAPLFESLSLEDSPMHDLFLNVLSSSEVQEEDPASLNGSESTIEPSSTPSTFLMKKKERRASKENTSFTGLSTFVDIKVWTKGSIEVQRIIEHMEKIVNQTTAEYQFEWYSYLAEARDHSPMDYSHFISDVQKLLDHATKMETPSVRTLNIPLSVPSWAISSFLRELKKRLTEINGEFHTDVYFSEVPHSAVSLNAVEGSTGEAMAIGKVDLSKRDFLTHHIPSASSIPSSHPLLRSSNISSDYASGIPRYHGWYPYDLEAVETKSGELADVSSNLFYRSTRQFALLCTKDSLLRAWNPKQTSLKVGRDTLASRSLLARSLTPGSTNSSPQAPSGDMSPSIRSFAVMFLDSSSHLQLYAYNWPPTQMEILAQSILRDTNFVNLRQHLIGNVLHQKMGLFYHNSPMSELTTTPSWTGPAQLAATSYRTSSALSKMSRFLPPSTLSFPTNSTSANTPLSTLSPTTGSGVTQIVSAPTAVNVGVQANPMVFKFTFENLEYLSQNSSLITTKRTSIDDKSAKDSSGTAASKDPPSSPANAGKAKRRQAIQKLNDLKIDELLRRISPVAQIPFNIDPVFRHASQFVHISEKYLRYHQIQQTLLHIYNQWSKNTKRPGSRSIGPSVPPVISTATKPSGNRTNGSNSSQTASVPPVDEKGVVDTAQLATLLKYARMFHSVKIPFFLSDMFIKEDLFEGPSATAVTGTKSTTAKGEHAAPTSDDAAKDAAPTTRLVPIIPNADSPLASSASSGAGPTSAQPFLYSAGETTQRVISRPELNLRFDPTSHPREKQLKYRQTLLDRFMEEFTTYLATFGVTPVTVKPASAAAMFAAGSSSNLDLHTHSQSSSPVPSNGSAPSTPTLSKMSHSLSPADSSSPLVSAANSSTPAQTPVDIWPPKQQRYLQKVFRGGLILFEVEGGGPGNFEVSCNLFTLFFTRLTAYFGASEDVIVARTAASLRHLAHFTREITNIKTQLHMNSFVYDFHVRQLSEVLNSSSQPKTPTEVTGATSAPANKATTGAPGSIPQAGVSANPSANIPPVEIINQLQAMVIYYENPPKHARTAISSSHITLEVTNALLSPLELFAYASKNAVKFEFQATEYGLTPGIARTANSHCFEAPAASRTPGPSKTKDPEEDSWLMVAFMSHTSDASSATNQAISASLSSGGHGSRALESNYNACYRVARKKHLSAMAVLDAAAATSVLSSADSSTNHPSTPAVVLSPSTSSTSLKIVAPDYPSGPTTAPLTTPSTPGPQTLPITPTPAHTLSPSKAPRVSSTSSVSMPSTPKQPKHLTVSFFVLRIATHTKFPLMASAYSTPPPVSWQQDEEEELSAQPAVGNDHTPILSNRAPSPPSHGPPTSLASFNRRNMHDALHNCRTLLTNVATRAIVESERDLLWNKLVGETTSGSSEHVGHDQMRQLIQVAFSKPIDTLDQTLATMTGGITTDWKGVMNQLSSTYSAFYRTRVFLSQDQQPHLLIFNPADSDLLLHLFVQDHKRLEVHCVRRESCSTLEQKHAKLEAVQVSQLVNTICHLLWKQLLPKPQRR